MVNEPTRQEPTIAIQLPPQSVFDEGPERCLDNLQQTAGVNNVMVFTHTFVAAGKNRHPDALADDHGVPRRDPRTRELETVWVHHSPEVFRGQRLVPRRAAGAEYAGADVLEALAQPAAERGIAVYARLLEGGKNLPAQVEHGEEVMTVDLHGNPGRHPCWNHPDYAQFLTTLIGDLADQHRISGVNYGSERYGPLSDLIVWGRTPECFCPHCVRAAADRRVDAERARLGFLELERLIRTLAAGNDVGRSAPLALIRVLLRYPEIAAWEQLAHEWREMLNRKLYERVKSAAPDIEFGVHVDHQKTTWDPISKAEVDYAEMAEYNDYIKPVVYHDVAGPRLKHYGVLPLAQTVLRGIPEEEILTLLYHTLGFSPASEPAFSDLDDRGLSAEYVRREVERCVAAVGDKAAVYPGIGVDIPFAAKPQDQNWERVKSDPDHLAAAVTASFEAGASGIVICREYDEISLQSLRVIGRAIAGQS